MRLPPKRKVNEMAYTATYRKIASGYLGQIVEWPRVVTEGKNLEDCRASLKDALHEMLAAYHDLGRAPPEPRNIARC